MTEAARFFQESLRVTFLDTATFPAVTNCLGVNIPAVTGPYDLNIFVEPQNTNSVSYFAAAAICGYTTSDERPAIGIYFLNFNPMRANPLTAYQYFSTFTHELTHILGFSSSAIGFFRNDARTDRRPVSETLGSITISGRTYRGYILPELLNYAKSFYGCDSITAVPVEDDATNNDDGLATNPGSHWEKAFLPMEYMNPVIEYPGIISQFTFLLLKNTGWYTVRDKNSNYSQKAKFLRQRSEKMIFWLFFC